VTEGGDADFDFAVLSQTTDPFSTHSTGTGSPLGERLVPTRTVPPSKPSTVFGRPVTVEIACRQAMAGARGCPCRQPWPDYQPGGCFVSHSRYGYPPAAYSMLTVRLHEPFELEHLDLVGLEPDVDALIK
jgi:hypothetical protein